MVREVTTRATAPGRKPPTMLPLLLALGSGMGWGTADFLAGLAARRQALFVVMAVSQGAGLVFVAAVVLLRGEAPQQAIAVWYGVAAGASVRSDSRRCTGRSRSAG
jgi:hypothetical protein